MSRTQDEIVARIAAAAADDWAGFRREVLTVTLDFEHAKPFLKGNVTAEQWAESRTTNVEGSARQYLTFAIGKIEDHRGISASRSVDKLTEFAWLMGRDDIVEAMNAADYAQYGAPKVKAFAEGMGWPFFAAERAALERMAAGRPCTDNCDSGCGQ